MVKIETYTKHMLSKNIFSRHVIERLTVFLLVVAPLFLVTVRSWINAILIICSLICISLLVTATAENKNGSYDERCWRRVICLTFIAPMIAIFLSSVLRQNYVWSDYDSPARFLLSIAILIFAIRKRLNIIHFLQYTAPASLIITFVHQTLFSQPKLWGGRMSTYFADPLVFGYTSIALGLISLVSINIVKQDSKVVILFKLSGFIIGTYLSVMSESRTGWLAVPAVIVFWLYQTIGKSHKPWYFSTIVVMIAVLVGIFNYSTIIHQRLLTAFSEINSYPWTGMAPETSIGLRITFLRIAFDMFVSSPIAGFGDTSHGVLTLPNHINTYASPESLRMAFISGFHNEIVTNAVRYGIGGLLTSLSLFLLPFLLYFSKLGSFDRIQRSSALVGMTFTICFFISSLSTEVFDLKYTASFYALMTALLCAASIADPKAKNTSNT